MKFLTTFDVARFLSTRRNSLTLIIPILNVMICEYIQICHKIQSSRHVRPLPISHGHHVMPVDLNESLIDLPDCHEDTAAPAWLQHRSTRIFGRRLCHFDSVDYLSSDVSFGESAHLLHNQTTLS